MYFEDFEKLLLSEKDYIKMRSFIILCILSKWDSQNKINNIIDNMLNIFDILKPALIRVCFAKIDNLLIYKPELSKKIEIKLKNIDCSKYKETMSPLIEKDINLILKKIVKRKN